MPIGVGPRPKLCHTRAVRRVIDWVFTFPFLVAFGAILLVFDPAQRLARLFGRRPQEIVAGWLQVCLVWAIRVTGARVSVERSPHLEPGRPYLFIGNHQSMFDIPIHGATLLSHFPKYVSKRELAQWIPSISYNLRAGGNAIIDRSDRGQATEVMSAAVSGHRASVGLACWRWRTDGGAATRGAVLVLRLVSALRQCYGGARLAAEQLVLWLRAGISR